MLSIIFSKTKESNDEHARRAVLRAMDEWRHDPDRPLIPSVDEAMYHAHCPECGVSTWNKWDQPPWCEIHREENNIQQSLARERARIELEKARLELEQMKERV